MNRQFNIKDNLKTLKICKKTRFDTRPPWGEKGKTKPGNGGPMKESDFIKISAFFDNAFQFGVHSICETKSMVWEVPAEIKRLSYLRAQNCKGHNIYIRPLLEYTQFFLLVDDLNQEQVNKHNGEHGRLIIESSPRNYQVWIRCVNPISDDVKKLLLIQLQSDPGAAPNKRWGRAPGYTNRKSQYLMPSGLYPYAKLHYIDSRPVEMVLPEISPEATRTIAFDAAKKETGTQESFCREDYETGDPSRTDIRYCMALVRRGLADSEIIERLISERIDWRHHQGGNRLERYLVRTIERARSWTLER